MEKVVNIHMVNGKRPHFDIYIGRRTRNTEFKYHTKWANHFIPKIYGLEKSLELYEEHIRNSPELWDDLDELEGKVLGCWCKPKPCHGDILIKLMNEIG